MRPTLQWGWLLAGALGAAGCGGSSGGSTTATASTTFGTAFGTLGSGATTGGSGGVTGATSSPATAGSLGAGSTGVGVGLIGATATAGATAGSTTGGGSSGTTGATIGTGATTGGQITGALSFTVNMIQADHEYFTDGGIDPIGVTVDLLSEVVPGTCLPHARHHLLQSGLNEIILGADAFPAVDVGVDYPAEYYAVKYPDAGPTSTDFATIGLFLALEDGGSATYWGVTGDLTFTELDPVASGSFDIVATLSDGGDPQPVSVTFTADYCP